MQTPYHYKYRLIILSSLGGLLEFYDFIIFGLFAGYISQAFFPTNNTFSSLMITFGTFAIGYLARPLGGVVFGHFGDRIGRKKTFSISILLMAFATLGIACIPSYQILGLTAALLVLFCRILQGFSLGGEIPGALTYISETFSQSKGLAFGITFCGLNAGIIFATLLHAGIHHFLTVNQINSFGWRIPFIVGGFFGLLSLSLRKNLPESKAFRAIEHAREKYPLITILRTYPRLAVVGTLLMSLSATIGSCLFLFIPTYFKNVLQLPSSHYSWELSLTLLFASCISLIWSYLSDFIAIQKLCLWAIGLTILLAYPIFYIYVHYFRIYMLSFFFSALLLGFSSASPILLTQLFPTKIRYSGIALSYNLSFAIFGGLTPFLSISLIYYSGNLVSPALLLTIIALLGLLALWLWQSKPTIAESPWPGHLENPS